MWSVARKKRVKWRDKAREGETRAKDSFCWINYRHKNKGKILTDTNLRFVEVLIKSKLTVKEVDKKAFIILP